MKDAAGAILLPIVLIFTALPALAQDVVAGRFIAEQWCSACHQIAAAPKAESDRVPSFASIANMPSTTTTSLKGFLSVTHGQMPDLSLARSEIENVSAYILSLRKH